MMTERNKTTADLSRAQTMFLIYASDKRLILVTNDEHYLYNPRVKYPPNEELAFSLANGIQTAPIALIKDGSNFLVIDGCQEVIAARWIDSLIDAGDERAAFRGGHKMELNAMVYKFKDEAEAVAFVKRADARRS
jgi:hypothetical protein